MHQQVEGQPSKTPKKSSDNSAVVILKNSRQLGCVFEDTKPPKSSSTPRKGIKVLALTRNVQFSKNALRHKRIRRKQRCIAWCDPAHQSSRAQSVRSKIWGSVSGADGKARAMRRGDAWRMAKSILMLKEKGKATFFSPTEVWCLPAPSVMKTEERECVVDSGTSMHMPSRKDFNSAEMVTVQVSKSPTTVITIEKCKQMRKQQCKWENWICSWQESSSKIRRQFSHLKNSAKITDTPMSGPVVSYHIC